ncbi:uncharacterized protein PG986_002498 [Apiospora aurea]|uniref:RecQ mediated genome instability protein 1 N-terminal domain-containing protein n=1 Tax=Apiospora aurea TaxID=335848 RepID=A0ABR1QP01_9PEZI
MASFGLLANDREVHEEPQQPGVYASVSLATKTPKCKLMSACRAWLSTLVSKLDFFGDPANNTTAAGVDNGTTRTTRQRLRNEMCHNSTSKQESLESTDETFPLLPKTLWRCQSAVVRDRKGHGHHINHVIIDSAADYSTTTRDEANRLGLIRRPTLRKLALADGSTLEAVEYVTLRLSLPEIGLGDIAVNALLLPTLPQGHVLLIGLTDIIRHGIVAKIAERQSGWEKLESTLELELKPGLACVILTGRTKGKLINVDGATASLLADMETLEQKESDEKKRKPDKSEAAYALKYRNSASSSTSGSSTPSSAGSDDQGSQSTEITTPSTKSK